MVREKIEYICDKCNVSYGTKEEAIECEADCAKQIPKLGLQVKAKDENTGLEGKILGWHISNLHRKPTAPKKIVYKLEIKPGDTVPAVETYLTPI